MKSVHISISDFEKGTIPKTRDFNDYEFVHKGIGNLLAEKEAAEQTKRMQEQMAEEYEAVMYGSISGMREYEYVQDSYGNFRRQPVGNKATSTKSGKLMPEFKSKFPLYDEAELHRLHLEKLRLAAKPRIPAYGVPGKSKAPIVPPSPIQMSNKYRSPQKYNEFDDDSSYGCSESMQQESLDQLEHDMVEYRSRVLNKHKANLDRHAKRKTKTPDTAAVKGRDDANKSAAKPKEKVGESDKTVTKPKVDYAVPSVAEKPKAEKSKVVKPKINYDIQTTNPAKVAPTSNPPTSNPPTSNSSSAVKSNVKPVVNYDVKENVTNPDAARDNSKFKAKPKVSYDL